jgi:hypothetical protein
LLFSAMGRNFVLAPIQALNSPPDIKLQRGRALMRTVRRAARECLRRSTTTRGWGETICFRSMIDADEKIAFVIVVVADPNQPRTRSN